MTITTTTTPPGTAGGRRAARAAALLLTLLVALGISVLGPTPNADAATVCSGGNVWGARSVPIYADNNPRHRRLATLWYHHTGRGGCTVLRADAWLGTPHVMGINVCGGVPGAGGNFGRGCSGWERGNYSSYAGPVYWNEMCADVRVYLQSPSRAVVYDRTVRSPFACN